MIVCAPYSRRFFLFLENQLHEYAGSFRNFSRTILWLAEAKNEFRTGEIFKKGMRAETIFQGITLIQCNWAGRLGFVWTKINDNGTLRPPVGGRAPNTGYSDHF